MQSYKHTSLYFEEPRAQAAHRLLEAVPNIVMQHATDSALFDYDNNGGGKFDVVYTVTTELRSGHRGPPAFVHARQGISREAASKLYMELLRHADIVKSTVVPDSAEYHVIVEIEVKDRSQS